jgi:hypothetical protein
MELHVNQRRYTVEADRDRSLLLVLREKLASPRLEGAAFTLCHHASAAAACSFHR